MRHCGGGSSVNPRPMHFDGAQRKDPPGDRTAPKKGPFLLELIKIIIKQMHCGAFAFFFYAETQNTAN